MPGRQRVGVPVVEGEEVRGVEVREGERVEERVEGKGGDEKKDGRRGR